MSIADVATAINYLRKKEDTTDGWLHELATIPNLSEAGREFISPA